MKNNNPPLGVKQKYVYLLIGFVFLIILAFYAGYKIGQHFGEHHRLEITN